MSEHNRGWISSRVQCCHQRLNGVKGLASADLLSAQRIQQVLQAEGVRFRECVFTPTLTLWTFLSQVLSRDASCQNAVCRALAFLTARGEKPCSSQTDPYCKARQRLPERVVSRLAREVGREIDEPVSRSPWLGGRPVKIIDGSTASMPDTPANQKVYPQARTQKPGLGFPLLRFVVLFSLSSGAALDMAMGKYRGKRTGETALLRQLWDKLDPGDVLLGDCYFASFWNVALLKQRGVDSVFRMHHQRKYDFRRGRRLGPDDHVVAWRKPPRRPAWMNAKTYRELPDELEVREVRIHVRRPGFRVRELVIVTTLLDAEAVTKEELAEIYRARWNAELDLRSLKVTLGMDVLRCKSPEMVRKEMWMHLLAYNLIRTVMAQAADQANLAPRTLSFSGACQTLTAIRDAIALVAPSEAPRLYQALLTAVAAHRVGDRPNRCEPRAVKRRPKPHRLLTIPRDQARSRLLANT